MSKSKWVISGLLLPACFAGGVWLWDRVNEPPVPTLSLSKQTTARAASSRASSEAGAKQSAPSGSSAPSSALQYVQMPELPTAGNLGAITLTRAQISQAKLHADLEEQRARERKAAASTAAFPLVVGTPTSSTSKIPELPQLEMHKSVTPGGSSGTSSGGLSTSQGDLVVGIQGIEGKLTATIRSKGKLVTVRIGQTISGGVVSSISRHGVTIKQGGSIRTLAFE